MVLLFLIIYAGLEWARERSLKGSLELGLMAGFFIFVLSLLLGPRSGGGGMAQRLDLGLAKS